MIVSDRHKKKWFWAENYIIDREDLSSLEKMAYLVLCRYADNDTNTCFPAHATLSRKVGCSRRKIIDVVKSLKAKGLIDIDRRTSEHGDPTSNLYVIFSAKSNGGKEEVVQENHYPVHALHCGNAPDKPGVVNSMHTNNTNYEPSSFITTTTTTKTNLVVVTEEIEEELKKSIALTPFASLYPFSSSNLLLIADQAYFACLVLDVYSHQYKGGWRPRLPEAAFRDAIAKRNLFIPVNYIPLVVRVYKLKKEAENRQKEETQRWSIPDEEIRSAFRQIAAL